MGRGYRRRNDEGSVGPLMSLHQVSDRHRGRGVPYLEISGVQLLHGFELLNNLGRVGITSSLQVRVYKIVHGMQFLAGIAQPARRIPRRSVRRDGVFPEAQSRKDVAWHVRRM